jgi:hypothetical protein
LKGLALFAAIALLGATYAVHAEDAKGPSEVQQDRPPQEQPNTMPPDTMKREPGIVSTGHDEIDSKFTRPALRTSVAILFAVKKKASLETRYAFISANTGVPAR